MGQSRKDTSHNHDVEHKKPDTKGYTPYCVHIVSIIQGSQTSLVREIIIMATFWGRIIFREASRMVVIF